MTLPQEYSPRQVTIAVPGDVGAVRIDRFLTDHPKVNLTRTQVQKLISEELCLVDGKSVPKNLRLAGGESIELTIPPAEPFSVEGEDIPLDIRYEDEHLLVVNKPAGLVTHPARGNLSGTLVNGIVHYLGEAPHGDADERPGIVHRLDKDTSGLLIVARTEPAYVKLQQMIRDREVSRIYLALVCGHVKEAEGIIDLPLGRSPRDRRKMAVVEEGGRESRTEYAVVKRYRSWDFLEVRLHTGRTHQIRVHFSHLGHPVFGDPDYGGRQKWHGGMFGPERPLANRLLDMMPRQALHAHRLEFNHPLTGRAVAIESDPPEDMAAILRELEAEG